MKMKRSAVILSFTAASLLLSGCVKIWQENLDIKTYMIEAERAGEAAAKPLGRKLWIDTVSVLPPYNIRNLILRKNDVEFETSYYTELLLLPAENIQNELYRWFASSGLFEEFSLTDRAGMSHRLSATVLDFYGDASAKEAVLKIKLNLLDETKRVQRILLSRDYSRRIPVDEVSAEELIRAYNLALTQILGDAEADVAEALMK